MRHNPSSHAVKSTVCSKLPPPLYTLVRNLSNWSERKVCLGGQCYELTVTFITCQEWALWKRFPWIQSVNSSAKTSYVQSFRLSVLVCVLIMLAEDEIFLSALAAIWAKHLQASEASKHNLLWTKELRRQGASAQKRRHFCLKRHFSIRLFLDPEWRSLPKHNLSLWDSLSIWQP